MRWFSIYAVAFGLASQLAVGTFAMTLGVPRRGGPDGPVVLGDWVVFTTDIDETGKGGIVCINRASGSKIWETRTERPEVWSVIRNWVIVTSYRKVLRCDLETGKLEPIFQTTYSTDKVDASVPGSLLVFSEAGELHELNLIDTSTWARRWTVTNAWRLLHRDATGILVLLGFGPWSVPENRFVEATPSAMKLAVLSPQTGMASWSMETRLSASPQTTALLPDCVLVAAGGLVTRLPRDGLPPTRRRLVDGVAPPLWVHEGVPCVIISNQVCSLNPRSLEVEPRFDLPRAGAFSAWEEKDYIFYKTTLGTYGYEKNERRDVFVSKFPERWNGVHDGKLYSALGSGGVSFFDLRSGEIRILFRVERKLSIEEEACLQNLRLLQLFSHGADGGPFQPRRQESNDPPGGGVRLPTR